MELALPPPKLIRYDESTTQYVYDRLTSVIIRHPMAEQPFTFYEEIDAWLGPWGPNGYPLGYGKFYAIAFNSNPELMADPETKEWVWNTTRFLQESLRDYIIERMRAKTLHAITELELRRAAFASHAKAYTDGGLAKVVLVSPIMILIVMLIPGKEFNPAGATFGPTVRQVFETLGILMRQLPGYFLGGIVGPAHSGLFAIASRRDELNYRGNEVYSRALSQLREAINAGDVDDARVLQKVIESLTRTEYQNQQLAQQGRTALLAAGQRLRFLKRYYSTLLETSPTIKKQFESRFGNLLRDSTATVSLRIKGQ
jgi:hypothetical protein